ncbi:hypothetical protein [Geobacter argillaceus]|uniref:Peptidylprolyl isomerase n=1 Tax=Geobacter argillaceus TaxID=345631 RepID=A0A562VFP1_9BACT|nr:hypothetical protein [Geobacter argillaceus]TWJ16695.1 hypothetical protein JN12_03267 [Geobacter argillaceus]
MRMNNSFRLGTLLLAAACAGGCATAGTGAPIAAGDPVMLQYTCRLVDGTLAATTRSEEEVDNTSKASLYLRPAAPGPVSVIAGQGLKADKPVTTRSFEDEIAVQLAKRLVGLPAGVGSQLEISGDGSLLADGQSHKLPMATVRQRLKEHRLDRAGYKARTGKEPEIGQEFAVDPMVPGKVAEINGDEVLIRFTANVGSTVETPFGKGVIRETPEHFEIVLSPVVGSLVRTGPIVGRIAEANERQFVVDYSDFFGGETLTCTATPERSPSASQAAR